MSLAMIFWKYAPALFLDFINHNCSTEEISPPFLALRLTVNMPKFVTLVVS